MLGPVIAWNLSGVPSRPKSLTIDGLDVAAAPPGSNTYHVDPRSVHVKEAGPGQVSSLEFVIIDPQAAITVSPGMFVRFDDRTLNLPIFAGWVESWESAPLGLGRVITVGCIGVEAWLDWAYVPAFTILTGTELNAAVMSVLAAATGLGVGVRWAADVAGFGLSSVAFPVGFGSTGSVTTFDVAIPGGSVRQSIQALGDAINSMTPGAEIEQWAVTVDFYLGVRVWNWTADGGFTTSDYAQVDIRTTGAHPRPSNTRYGINGSGSPRAVYVKGGASVGYASDGSGLPGPVAVITNANAGTIERRLAIGRSYLASRGISASGRVTTEGGVTLGTFGSQTRAGAFVAVNDPQAGMSVLVPLFIQSIDKVIAPSGEETWTFAFGATVPRAAAYLRSLTSGQLI